MKNLWMIKQGSSLIPQHGDSQERFAKLKQGRLVQVDIKQPRNPAFHAKFMSMITWAYEYWEPTACHKGEKIDKNFERYRKDLLILAGHYEIVVNINNETRLEAKSMSFASCDEEDFHKLYTKVFNVLWEKVLSKVPNMTQDEAHNVIAQLESYL